MILNKSAECASCRRGEVHGVSADYFLKAQRWSDRTQRYVPFQEYVCQSHAMIDEEMLKLKNVQLTVL